MRTSGQKGFTLIELLVVIAIIGILASLVLVALQSARNKSRDARIKSNIQQLRLAAIAHYDNVGSYAGYLASVAVLTDDIVNKMGGTSFRAEPNAAGSLCISAVLNSGQAFCLDTRGGTGSTTCTVGAGTCP